MSYEYSRDTATTSQTTITDPEGHRVLVRHADYHLLASLTRGSGSAEAATSSFTRDPQTMQTTSTTDPRGQVWQSSYDTRANLLARTDPLGNRTSYTYNALNQPLSETDALGVTKTRTYDSRGNLTGVSRPVSAGAAPRKTSYAYDPAAQTPPTAAN